MLMTLLLTIALFLTAGVGISLFRRELLAMGHAVVAGVREFKARMKELDDELWRR